MRAIVLFTAAACAAAAFADSECGLRGADTVITTGVTNKKCLDLTGLDNKTVVIPSNVKRIDNTGFALCESSESSGGAADIVYVMDQSGSMGINYVWVSPDQKDTVYLESLAGCSEMRQSDAGGAHGSITIPSDATVRTVPKLNPNKSIAGCNSTSGDPFTQRGIALKEAIDFQALRAPNSTAGYIGFAGSVVDPVRPVKLNTQANIDRVKRNIVPRLLNNTNYTAPLDTAKRWLLQPSITSNPEKAVIFLSDGRPLVDVARINTVLSETYAGQPGKMPPVYGILLAKPTADTAILDSISKFTGGKFFLIPPSRPDSLKAVVAQILNVILHQFKPNSAAITNGSTVPPGIATAGAGSFTRQGDGSWLMNLDKVVPLNANATNLIKLETQFLDEAGAPKARTINFTLSTTGAPDSLNHNLPGTQFSVVCKDLPPPIDPVKVAYIQDADGDGAADLVVFVFTRPLPALPASIDAIYWPDFGDAFKNRGAPKLSFLTASGNTVVLADLSAAPFDKGVTSIPKNGAPIAVLPAGGVFGGQRPPIQDSIGPILMSAEIKPFDVSKSQGPSDLNLDTITITASEPIRTKTQWTGVLLWSKSVGGKCSDYVQALPVVPSGQPEVDLGQTKVTLYVPNTGETPTPSKGDCVYLSVNGDYTDLHFNIPPQYGVPLTGKDRSRQIQVFRGYPPVVGITADNPGFVVTNQDPRKGNGNFDDYSKKNDASGKYEVQWIPPVGFVDKQPFHPIIPPMQTPPTGTETGNYTGMPDDISTVQVVSTGKYIADVSIFDNRGNFLRRFKQAFGFNGELNNGNRIVPRGLVSYLVWDMKDRRGQKAGQGVYVWKVYFSFENGKQEIQYTRTGVVRRKGWDLVP
jgi:hypothetical protein